MKDVQRVRWLSRFDMEPLLSWVLIGGMLTSVISIMAGLAVGTFIEGGEAGYRIVAISIPRLIQADVGRFGSPDFWSRFLIDLGFSILLITPYLRLTVTWLYLALVKNRWRYALYTSVVLVLLGLVLFSDIVMSPGFSRVLPKKPFSP